MLGEKLWFRAEARSGGLRDQMPLQPNQTYTGLTFVVCARWPYECSSVRLRHSFAFPEQLGS